MTQKIRFISQLVFLGVFLLLTFSNQGQIWMGVIFLSIALAAIFGRYYCGWMCPIHTLIRPTRWLSQRLKMTKIKIPDIVKKSYVRWVVMAAFLPALGYTIYTIPQGRKFPLPVFIIGLGMLTTFFVNGRTWHRYLCPWGILLSATGKFSRLQLAAKGCTTCGVCVKSCPTEAIALSKNNAEFTSQYCLLCLQCKTACPVQAIRYQVRNR